VISVLILAPTLKEAIEARLAQCGLQLHPEKTKIVYCKDDDRRGNYPNEKFDFLGFTFRPRRAKNRWGKFFVTFSPAMMWGSTIRVAEEVTIVQITCRLSGRPFLTR